MRYILFYSIASLLFSCSTPEQKKDPDNSLDRFNQYINDSTLLSDKKYNETVFRHIRAKTLELLASDTTLKRIDNQWNNARMQVALELFTNQTVKNYWLHSIVSNQIENLGIKNIDNLLPTFYSNCTNPDLENEIKTMYKEEVASRNGHDIIVYKTTGGFTLDAHIFYPKNFNKQQKHSAILLFHGGSWYEGKVDWMFGACNYYAQNGLIAIAIEYRLYDRHGVSPDKCIEDAKSAIRWTRQNAEKMGIDPNKIAARGFSAGGHLIACAAMIDGINTAGEDTTISSSPNAMIFVSSCFDPTLDNWFVKQVEKYYPAKSCSPIHNIRNGLPPSIVIHSTADNMCPFWTAQKFSEEMTKSGNKCKLVSIDGGGHFFVFDEQYREQLKNTMNDFLVSYGYMQPNTKTK